ncbi:MAG: NTP transferase domain-containing protein [Planctomycetaceae bacterium]|nr:NTP transferase domain-containing protein [Planctomycetaceae bacterium]
MLKTLGIIDGLLATDRQRRNASRSLGGKTVIEWVARQLTDSLRLDGVVVTTDHSEENMFVKMMTPLDVPVFMTDASDTLSALSKTLESFQTERCVYIGLDWPLIDSLLIDRLIIAAESNPSGQYAAFEFENDPCRGRPHGMFAEWYDVKALHRANRKAVDPIHREYPGLYFLERVEKEALTLIPAPHPFDEHGLCPPLESEADWENITMIFESIDADNIHWQHIAELLLSLPENDKTRVKVPGYSEAVGQS